MLDYFADEKNLTDDEWNGIISKIKTAPKPTNKFCRAPSSIFALFTDHNLEPLDLLLAEMRVIHRRKQLVKAIFDLAKIKTKEE